jgi:monoamine oxidase
MTSLPRDCDIAVIGAGAAGLAAAKTAAAAGYRVVALEAKGRTGGRAWTECGGLGAALDHGCHWLHSADRNPWVDIARDLGREVGPEARDRHIHLGDRWAGDDEVVDWDEHAEAAFAAIEAAAGDVAADAVLDRDARWAPLFDAWLGMINGVNGEVTSTLDHANYVDTQENWRVEGGYGALVAAYGADAPVALDTPADRIDWGGKAIRVETLRGALVARAVIVTVSTAVLAAERIVFDPPLPDWKQEAVDGLPMGAAEKVALRFDADVFGDPADCYALFSSADADAMSFQVRSDGLPLAVGYAGGRLARELAAMAPDAAVDFALERLKRVFGSGIARHVVAAVRTGWAADPDIGGGYSAARPGKAHLRADMARPVDGRLFFAGEAASEPFYSTAHGAYLTGVAAAEAAMAAIGPA